MAVKELVETAEAESNGGGGWVNACLPRMAVWQEAGWIVWSDGKAADLWKGMETRTTGWLIISQERR